MIKMQEDLMRPAFNVANGRSHLFNGGPLNNKVVMVPPGVEVYAYAYMGHRHFYRVYSTGAYYQNSVPLT